MKTTGRVRVYSVLRSNKSPKVGLIDLRFMSESSLRKSHRDGKWRWHVLIDLKGKLKWNINCFRYEPTVM
jgi:hypothetical protein